MSILGHVQIRAMIIKSKGIIYLFSCHINFSGIAVAPVGRYNDFSAAYGLSVLYIYLIYKVGFTIN